MWHAVSHLGLHWLLGGVLVSYLQAAAQQQEKGPCHLQSLRAQKLLCLLSLSWGEVNRSGIWASGCEGFWVGAESTAAGIRWWEKALGGCWCYSALLLCRLLNYSGESSICMCLVSPLCWNEVSSIWNLVAFRNPLQEQALSSYALSSVPGTLARTSAPGGHWLNAGMNPAWSKYLQEAEHKEQSLHKSPACDSLVDLVYSP